MVILQAAAKLENCVEEEDSGKSQKYEAHEQAINRGQGVAHEDPNDPQQRNDTEQNR
jgi:hypothetical protein